MTRPSPWPASEPWPAGDARCLAAFVGNLQADTAAVLQNGHLQCIGARMHQRVGYQL